MKQAITGAKIFSGNEFFDHKALLIDGEKIIDIVNDNSIQDNFKIQKLNGGILSPGFIDLQVNGGGGKLFNNSPDKKSLDEIIKAHQHFGTTSIMPTVISDSLNVLKRCTSTITNEVNNNKSLLGLHIEGPFFNVKYRGVHQKQYINTINNDYLNLFETLQGFPVMLTLAPECISIRQLKHLKSLGFKILAGHTDASYDQLEEAIKYGLDGFTHLFNAMSQMTGRAAGTVGALINSHCHIGIICDGHHVGDDMIALAIRARPAPDLMFLVSDAMATVGGPDTFDLYGQTITLKDGKLVNADENLAGAHVSQAMGVKRLVNHVGITLEAALRMAITTPAVCIGRPDLANLVGRSVLDVIVLDNTFDASPLSQIV